ncbi:serine/threonine-protein kinase [Diaphorobacter ruginosibacter]|uniref:serine/threonine protein kinase n=1 Tax=Diaphorobacter ruginosibacter TaxID=1715720 RepID=UPI0033400444
MSEVSNFRRPGDVDHLDALPVGARLGEFEIAGLLGVGGFGMVYQAFDHSLLRFVAIKEYMPAALAGRAQQGHSVWVRSSADEPAFQAGLSSFVEEARLLAQFDHPSLVKVFRFWEAHQTAYMVMPLYVGMTLKQARASMRTPPPEAWLRSVIWSVCSALRVLHDGKTLHRDISPDNIFLQDSGPPVLLDLGAARFAIGDRDRKHTAVLKVNYAPIEQYADVGGELKPGPWSDIYSLAAVIYGCICNDAPLPSTLRSIRDRMVPFRRVARTVRKQFGVEYSAPFIEAIAKALALQPGDRHGSVDELLAQMGMTVAPAPLDKFDFRRELGDVWMEKPMADAGGVDLLNLGEPAASTTARNTDTEQTVLHLPGTPPPLAANGTDRGWDDAQDFQDTVVRGMDFEDSRDASFETPAVAAAGSPPGPGGGRRPSSSSTAGQRPGKPPSRKSGSGVGVSRKSTRRRPDRMLLASAATALVLLAGAAAWFMSSPSASQAAADPVRVAMATPDAEIITEMAEPEAASSPDSGNGVLMADSGAEGAASGDAAAPPAPMAREHKPRAAQQRKAAEPVPASREPVPAAEPAPAAAVAPQPAPQPPQPRRPSPEEACADAGFLARPMCIHNECQKPGMLSHPTCVDNARRREEERRQKQMYTQ